MPSGADGPPGRAVRLRASLPLPVAPETAWRIWSVVEDWPRWDATRSRDARWLEGAPWTVGARLRIGRRPGRFDCELVEIDPPRRVTWIGGFAGIRGRHSFGFLPHAGGCLMVSDEIFDGPGANLLAPVIRWAWSRQMGAFREWARAADDRS